MLTGEGIMAPYAAKKFPTAGVFSRLSPWGVAAFSPGVPRVAAVIKLNPTTLVCSLTNAD